jgi:3-dehydroquinate synthase
MSRPITVGLGDRAYQVVIGPGLLDQAGRHISRMARERRVAVVSDDTVWGLHGPRLQAALRGSEINAHPLIIPPGEAAKSFAGLADLCDRLLALELDRGDLIVAFGGGVVGDLAGFAAAILKRGIDFVQIPTTLLAQVDSSVGGKTAIDTPRGKNLIGAFHQPRLVLADLGVLSTLPDREMRAGYAEVIKYGLLGDAIFFKWLEANVASVLARDPKALDHAVSRSVEMKAEIVAEDETEQGRRALLNLGHTFGHALEAETGYGPALLHGEAVAVGMSLAFRYANAHGMCSGQDAQRAVAAIDAAGLPTTLSAVPGHPFSAERLVHHMAQDKKAQRGKLTFILPQGIGVARVVKAVEPQAVATFLMVEGAQP